MKKKILHPIIALSIPILLAMSFSPVYAQDKIKTGQNTAEVGGSQTSSDTGTKSLQLSLKLENPIRSDNILTLIDKILGIILKIGVPIIAVMFILAGFQYVMSRGNQAKVKAAHQNLLNLAIGTAVFLGAYTITKAIVVTINAITK